MLIQGWGELSVIMEKSDIVLFSTAFLSIVNFQELLQKIFFLRCHTFAQIQIPSCTFYNTEHRE